MADSLTTAQYAVERAVFDKNIADDDFVVSWIKLAKHHLATKLGDDMRKSLEKELEQATKDPTSFKAKWNDTFITSDDGITDG